ncbi:MAG: putative DNA binding domain-containing protein [Anaerolineae bacterium]|nr:putative DNA binding domain-containing protein [Anaerolineae bacterium]
MMTMVLPRQDRKLVLQPTPLTFVFNVLVIELLFALGPVLLFTLLRSSEAAYNELSFANAVSYPVLVTAAVALAQAMVVIGAFAVWYGRAYVIDAEDVVYQGGALFGRRHLTPTQAIDRIEVTQSRFGRQFDYGTLHLIMHNSAESVRLKNLTSPHYNARRIEQLLEPPDEAVSAKQMSVAEMLIAGEGQFVEFKASFLWDYRRNAVNKELNVPTMKNVAAYMNSAGGVVLLGVDDDGIAIGLEPDWQAINKPGVDGYENVLNMAFNRMIGAEYRHYLEIRFEEVDGQTVCVLAVSPSSYPVYLKHKGSESFYIRTGNSSQPLELSQAVRYIQTRFSAENSRP